MSRERTYGHRAGEGERQMEKEASDACTLPCVKLVVVRGCYETQGAPAWRSVMA